MSASDNTRNWTAAEDFCREEGGHLASMIDESFKDQILEEMTKTRHEGIWLGGNDIEEKSVWKWVDCTPWSVTFWAPGAPDSIHPECLALVLNSPGHTHLNKKWNDRNCGDKLGFLCKKTICGLNNGNFSFYFRFRILSLSVYFCQVKHINPVLLLYMINALLRNKRTS